MDRLVTLEVFVKVAELGSFTVAAAQLNLPRSTVSDAIRQLEARLATQLIQRTTRRLRLTPDGEACLEWGRRLLADVEETEARFRSAGAEPKGRLHVDVPTRMASLMIVPELPVFLSRYPGIELALTATDRLVDLVREGVDCAIRVGELRDSGLVAQGLGRVPIGNFASPGYLAQHGVPRSPADLAEHVAVGYLLPGTGTVDPWEYMADGKRHEVALRCKVSANTAETYIACCVAGLGLIQMPAYDARRHVEAGELVEVMPEWRAEPMQVSLLYPRRRHLSLRVRAFADWARELFGRALFSEASSH